MPLIRKPKDLTLDRKRIAAAVDSVGRIMIADTRKRCAAGIDIHGRKFTTYSSSYIEQLRRGGESTNVDLSVTGSLLQSLMVREKRSGLVLIGPSPTQHGPSVSFSDGTVKRTGRRRLNQDEIGRRLHFGSAFHSLVGAGMPPRPWLGLGPDGKRAAKRIFDKILADAIKFQ